MAPVQGPGLPGSSPAPGMVYSAAEIAWIALQFWEPNVVTGSKATARMAVAIALAESGGKTDAYNPRGLDNSYGLWQINMRGGLGPERREQFNLSRNEDLFSPTTNARAAFAISEGGKNWFPWSVYTNGKAMTYWNEAGKAVDNPKAPGNVQQGVTETVFTPWEEFKDWVGGGLLRIAGFVAGTSLIIGGIVLTAKKGVK